MGASCPTGSSTSSQKYSGLAQTQCYRQFLQTLPWVLKDKLLDPSLIISLQWLFLAELVEVFSVFSEAVCFVPTLNDFGYLKFRIMSVSEPPERRPSTTIGLQLYVLDLNSLIELCWSNHDFLIRQPVLDSMAHVYQSNILLFLGGMLASLKLNVVVNFLRDWPRCSGISSRVLWRTAEVIAFSSGM